MILALARGTARADWPLARGNGGRTGSSTVGPKGPLSPVWTLTLPPAASAWSGEARGSLWQRITNSLTSRAADDIAPVPVIADGLVLFGTTRDEVRCVRLDNGSTLWSHFCGGPVRFAPVVSGESVYVGSDDGRVHSLELRTGRLRWAALVGPEAPWVSGNGRLVSTCPVRTGLLVADGVVYVGAGLFPLEGTYLAALNAADGSVRWRRSMGPESPQGYLVDAGADVLVPCGRAGPRLFRKRDGSFVREVPSATGTFAVVAGDETLSGPGATGSIQASDARTGGKLVSYPGRQMAVTPTRTFLVDGLELLALDRAALRVSGKGADTAMVWKKECSGGSALIVAGDNVYCGTSTGVEVYEAATGRHSQSLEAGGPVAALAADERGLVVSARDGTIRGFLSAGPAASVVQAVTSETGPAVERVDESARSGVAAWLRNLPSSRGWALMLRPQNPLPELAALVQASELHVVLAVPPGEVDPLRRTLASKGWLGSRAAVVPIRADGSVPVVDHLFNLVVAADADRVEALRCACPAPSGALVLGGATQAPPVDARAGNWTHQYGTAANTCASSQPLGGSPRLQWFGGHGPERMPDRHTRGHAPLAAGGVQISMAENALIATDSRNGTIRWQVELPQSMRYAMPYDAGYAALRPDGRRVHVAVNRELWSIDGRSGSVLKRIPAPVPGQSWGWVAIEGDAVYGSAEFDSAPRTRKEFELVDLEYRSGRPLVCSKSVFRLDPGSSQVRWLHSSEGLLVNPTMCLADGKVLVVEARGPAARTNRIGRLTCTEILEEARVLCLDAGTGRLVWERPLRWPAARDILGLSAAGERLFLSSAESVGDHAEYHLRCWSMRDGAELWESKGRNPVADLYHGQQVKRPVILGATVAFESGLFDVATGSPWKPPGASADWILARPGHACGGMTGADGGLLFRAGNPTLFKLSDGSFTRLSPTRPGCWLNILPAEGGVLIPEASASCICAYPLQTSMAFGFGSEPAPLLPDIVPAPTAKP